MLSVWFGPADTTFGEKKTKGTEPFPTLAQLRVEKCADPHEQEYTPIASVPPVPASTPTTTSQWLSPPLSASPTISLPTSQRYLSNHPSTTTTSGGSTTTTSGGTVLQWMASSPLAQQRPPPSILGRWVKVRPDRFMQESLFILAMVDSSREHKSQNSTTLTLTWSRAFHVAQSTADNFETSAELGPEDREGWRPAMFPNHQVMLVKYDAEYDLLYSRIVIHSPRPPKSPKHKEDPFEHRPRPRSAANSAMSDVWTREA